MSTALTVLLVMVASGAADSNGSAADSFTPAVARATREALGPDARVVLRLVDALPDDAEAASLGAEMHADAVVEVTWALPDRLQTTIRVERASTERWLDRRIGFRAVDDAAERGRTVGLTIASMLPEWTTPSQAPAGPEQKFPSAPGDAAKESRARRSTRADVEAPHGTSASVVAQAAFGARDHGGSVGAALDLRTALTPSIDLRVAGSARVGEDPPAGFDTRRFGAAVGLSWSALRTENGRGSLGFRADGLTTLTGIVHAGPGGGTTSKYKLMPGAALLAEGAYYVTRSVGVVAGGGAEAVFGNTDVIVGERKVATLGPLRPIVELGLRVGF